MLLPRETLRQSELVFRAKIAKLGATTVALVPATENTIVVAVEEVYQSPDVLRLLAGNSITVLVKDTRGLHVGQQVLFLTTVRLYGESLAVVEVGRQLGEVDSNDPKQHLSAEAQAASDELLSDRITRATLIVAGRVLYAKAIEPNPLTMSEHSPLWSEVTIQVISVEKGTTPNGQVVVLYPESRDIMWYRAPKFHAGQEGVWILSSQWIEDLDRVDFTALDPLDFHPKEALERIRTLARLPK